MEAPSPFDVLTRTDVDSPGGQLLRRYWQPAALSEELPPGGPPIPVRLLGEDLVLFRDEEGRPGLLGIHCAHRGADLSYGRLEDGGIRCIYHGWLYDVHGRCLEQPGEPAGSTFHERIRQTSYPCIEKSDVIWTYMGPGEPPLLPAYHFLAVPDANVFAIKLFNDCNYLQGNEGNIDLLHLSFLHHNTFFDHGGDGIVRDPLTGGGSAPRQERVEAEITPYGLTVCKIRDMGDQEHLYICSYLVPAAFTFQGYNPADGYCVNWHVPIDDAHHWKYTFIFGASEPMDKEAARRGRADMTPDYRAQRSRANRYLQDRDSMKANFFAGMGMFFQVHDLCVTEGAGPIQDRSSEHLTLNDAPLVAARNLLIKGIKDIAEGQDPPHVIRTRDENEFPPTFARSVMVPKGTDWKAYLRTAIEEERRAGAANAGSFAGGQLEAAFGRMLAEREQTARRS